ncbi:hypothetical protein [Pimelobacter sp. 30-1]|uniref:hypothetical protein n=1 Tax=Pimelobacter sp. 30-1 TaxID=2004991 RepID=UPI001C05B31C|nr:hypothetical protein [Pimelobacter sp. 30-1]MBU2694901.1 hypothetical protein [Pimelobacter sp. 30-1]
MPLELTTAVLLAAFALLCAGWLLRSRPVRPDAGPAVDEWRDAALRHFSEHRDLQRTVATALSTPGAVTGTSRRDLMVALGAPQVDVYA